MPLRAKRMKGLRIDEASGVDAPAHLAPGWMVMKAAGNRFADPLADLTDEQIDALIKAAEAEEESPMPNDDLIASLTKALGTMPEPAKAQATSLIAQLGDSAGAGDDPVAKAVADALAKAAADTEAAESRATAAEDALAKAQGTATETEEEALAKAMESLPEPVRKAWAADRERVAKAEKDAAEAVEKANVEREARVGSEYLTKAKGPDYANLPAGAETVGTILREVDEKLSKEAGAELHRILKAASHLAAGGAGDFHQWGGAGGDATGATGAMSQLEAKAAEIMAGDSKLTKAEAISKAADLNPELVRAHEEAMR